MDSRFRGNDKSGAARGQKPSLALCLPLIPHPAFTGFCEGLIMEEGEDGAGKL
jgi:hypothetical protein